MQRRYTEMLISHYRWPILAGAVLLAVSPFTGFGAFTGGMAIWLGACGGTFRRWRDEPGLWMLSGLFLAMGSAALVTFVCILIEEVFRPGQGLLPRIDFAVATLLLAVQVLFLATVTRTNWLLRKRKKPILPG